MSGGLAGFSEQDIANLAWAYATLKISQTALFHMIDLAVKKRTSEFLAKGLVNTTWAFAVQRCDPTFLPEVVQHLRTDQRKVGQMDAKGCAVLLWSLANLRANGDMIHAFFACAAERWILPRVQEFQPRDMSNVLWAFAGVRMQHDRVFAAIERQAKLNLQAFTPQALANMAWSYAKLQATGASILPAASREALRRNLRDWPPQAIVTLAWSMMETHQEDVDLLRAAMHEFQARSAEFNDVDIATLAAMLLADSVWRPEDGAERSQGLSIISRQTQVRSLPRTSQILSASSSPHAVAGMFDNGAQLRTDEY